MFTKIGRICLLASQQTNWNAVPSTSHQAALLYAILCSISCASDGASPTPADAGLDESGFVDSADAGSPIECAQNGDCADSDAARLAMTLRCAWTDLYCLAGKCNAECGKRCQVVITDQNPCTDGRLCAPLVGSGASFCTIMPIKCMTTSDCPQYLPRDRDGGQSVWACDNGICQYPGWNYATH